MEHDEMTKLREWRGNAQTVGLHMSELCNRFSFSSMDMLADRLGVDVEYERCPSIQNFSGILNQDGEPFIVINSAKSRSHQEYTIAHELAHFLLGHKEQSPKTEFQAQVAAFMVIYAYKGSGTIFDTFDNNTDIRPAISYAWMPDFVLKNSLYLKIVNDYIDSLNDAS